MELWWGREGEGGFGPHANSRKLFTVSASGAAVTGNRYAPTWYRSLPVAVKLLGVGLYRILLIAHNKLLTS